MIVWLWYAYGLLIACLISAFVFLERRKRRIRAELERQSGQRTIP